MISVKEAAEASVKGEIETNKSEEETIENMIDRRIKESAATGNYDISVGFIYTCYQVHNLENVFQRYRNEGYEVTILDKLYSFKISWANKTL